MARGLTIKIEGLRELDKALGDLKKATAKAVARRTLEDAGEITAQAARGMAPREYGFLVESIDVGTKLTRRQAGMHKAESSPTFQEVFVGTADPAAVPNEFGTYKMGPQPFMRPAWDSTKASVLERITHSLWANISKAAARAEKLRLKRGG